MSSDPRDPSSTSTTLIRACRSGESQPLGELHAFVRPVLGRWVRRVRRAGTPDFDEFFNECWLRIQQGVTNGAYDRSVPFRAWVGGLARHVLLELGRAQLRAARVAPLEEELVTPDPLDTLFEEEWFRELRTRALELTERQTSNALFFRAFVMRDLEGIDYPEIATRLGLGTDERTLESLHRQVHKVRKTFEENLKVLFERMT